MSEQHRTPLLNLDECQQIVQKFNQESGNNLQAKSFSIFSATKAKGFLGIYFHLKIQCKKPSTSIESNKLEAACTDILLSFFVKGLPTPTDNEKVRIFRKESSLYESLLTNLQKYSPVPWSPKIYLCYRNLLVLEDLSCAGYTTLDSKTSLTETEMFSVLISLSAMHASSLLYELETGTSIKDLFGENLEEITVHPDVAWFKTGQNAILELAKQHPKYTTEVYQKFITTHLPIYIQRIYAMVNPSTKYRNVLCHRDTWGGNIFLNLSKPLEPAILVDFQTCRYCPAAIDVIFTLFMNLTPRERIEQQSKYVKFYYQQLFEHIKGYISCNTSIDKVIFTETELLESLEEFKLFGFVYRALAITVLKVPKEFVTDYYKNVERTERLLQYMNENESFSQMMNESIEDIIEEVVRISRKENVNHNTN